MLNEELINEVTKLKHRGDINTQKLTNKISRLESSFVQSETIAEIYHLNSEPESKKTFEPLVNRFQELAESASNIANERQTQMPKNNYERLIHIARICISLADYYEGMNLFLEAFQEENFNRQETTIRLLFFINISEALTLFSQGIDYYWEFLVLDSKNMIKELAEIMMKSTAQFFKDQLFKGYEEKWKIPEKGQRELTIFMSNIQLRAGFILWKIGQFEKGEQFDIEKNMFSSIKHMGRTEAEQVERNKGAMAWSKSMLKESEQNKATTEDIEEYWEIQKILKRDE